MVAVDGIATRGAGAGAGSTSLAGGAGAVAVVLEATRRSADQHCQVADLDGGNIAHVWNHDVLSDEV